MAIYTKVSQALVEDIIAPYALGNLLEIEPIAGGQANSSVWLKTADGTYILSICDEKSSEEIDRLTTILEYLEQFDYPTSRVIKTGSGLSVLEHEGNPVYLKRYIEGSVPDRLNPRQVFQLGEQLALLHRIPSHKSLLDTHSYGIETFAEVFASDSPDQFGPWLKQKAAFLERHLEPDLPRGFIHGDLFYDNTVFQGDDLAAVLDFEEACFYVFVFDLGMSMIGACALDGRLSMELVRSLIKGYQSIRQLSQAEKAQLKLYAEYAAIGTAFWRFRQYHVRNPIAEKAETHLEMKNLAEQLSSMSIEQFQKLMF